MVKERATMSMKINEYVSLQQRLYILEGGLLPAQLQEALWSLGERITFAVVDLLHYLLS